MVNGVAMAHKDKTVFMLGSDGSQQEGNDAEAARLAAAQNLNVKLLIDDNDVTIAGHPSEYLKGYDVGKTLEGHGLKVVTVSGEDLDALWGGFHQVLSYHGPAAGMSLLAFLTFGESELLTLFGISHCEETHGAWCCRYRGLSPWSRCHPCQGTHICNITLM